MPGIADNQTQPINTAPIAAIGSEQPAAPAINDFMSAFRSGFITVDDLTRRTKQSVADTSNLQTTLSANDLTRRKAAAETSLLPGATAEAQVQQDIAATTAPARVGMAQEQADKFARYQADPQKFLAEESDRQVESTYIQAAGPLPETLFVKNPEKPVPYDEWLMLRNSANADAGLIFSGDVSDDPQTLRKEYDSYALSMEQVSVKRGTPEYAKALRKEVNTLAEKSLIQGARAKALQGILETQAKAEAESPGKAQASAQSNRKDYSTLNEIQDLRKVDAAYNKVKTAVTSASSPFQDMSAIFGFMKVLDPGSTVREGEYATAENARAVPETIKNFYNKIINGTKLTPEQRTQMLTATEGALAGQVKNALPRVKQYMDIEVQLGVNPGEIVPKEDAALIQRFGGATPGAAATAPSAGAKRVIQNGVTFEWNGTTYVAVQ